MPGALMWVWDDAAGEWVKMQVTAGGLVEVSVGNWPADPSTGGRQDVQTDLLSLIRILLAGGIDITNWPADKSTGGRQDVQTDLLSLIRAKLVAGLGVTNFPATYSLPAAQVVDLKKITEAPDPVISQPDPAALKHSPQTYDPGTPAWRALASDASGNLLVKIAALASLNNITDVNVPVLVDGDFLEWDTATSKWIKIAHKDVTTGVHGVSTAAISRITTGTYAGDDSVNRAIAHGLGVAPALVAIVETLGSGRYNVLVRARTAILTWYTGDKVVVYTVSAATSTNFYVGNATSYVDSANAVGTSNDWVAIA